MTVELDHVFVCTEAGAPEADRSWLSACAKVPQPAPRPGTACRRFFFRNAVLELVWVYDEREARSPPIAPAQLWERWGYRSTGYSPFGICLRPKNARRALSGRPAALPCRTWEWRPPYLPRGTRIDVAAGTAAVEPLVFATPYSRRPDAFPDDRRQPLVHPKGVAEITGLSVTLPRDEPMSGALRALQLAGVVSFQQGEVHLAEIQFDRGGRGESTDFRPALPLLFRW